MRDGPDAEMMGGDDAVVEDIHDVGLGCEAMHGDCVVFAAEGLDGGDAEVGIALGQVGFGGEGAGFGVGGDDGVAVDDEIVVGDDWARESVVGWAALRVKGCDQGER